MEVDPTGGNREVDPSIHSNLLLRTASGGRHAEIVRLLLNDPRVNPSDNNNDALSWAVMSENYEIVRMLLTYGKLLL
jgi:ankyrin repeat protein